MSEKFNRILILICLAVCGLLVSVALLSAVPEPGDYEDFLDALAKRESSDNYGAENRYGYLGRYQMGEKALKDAGFLDEEGAWTSRAGEYGIHDKSGFLESQEGQEAAIRAYHQKLCHYIGFYELDAYLGKQYCGVTVTESGLLAACHLVGARSMRDALAADKPIQDANGVQASAYMERFSGYDIGEVRR